MAHFTNVLKFWRSVETFTLPDIAAKRNRPNVYQELEAGKRLPWEPGALPEAREGKQWRHTIYFHVIDKEAVVDSLARLSGSEEYREPVGGRTCLSAMVVDQLGRPNERSYSSAAFIFGIKILREKKDPELLPELLKKAHEDYVKRWELIAEEVVRVDWRLLQKELSYLKELAGRDLPMKVSVLCVSEAVNVKAAVEAPFLNSYYLQDLNMLIGLSSPGRPLETFLNAEVGTRSDLLEAGALLKSLNPKELCAGRWPANPEQGLYSAQQAALNRGLALLGAGSGLIGINGPPGTGKTTLLRDVVAEVVVRRARRLLGVKVGDLFAGRPHKLTDMVSYYTPDAAVFGNDGIVVASNNNTAVENISRELPLARSVDAEAFEGPEYFSSIATNIQGEACWGMMSAVLGKSENRSAFIDKFWFNSGRGFGRYLKGEYGEGIANERHYEETAEELRGLLEEYDRFKDVAGEYHELVVGAAGGRLGELADVLKGEYGIAHADLPGAGFLDLSLAEIHRMRPYSSRKINLLRSKIFLCSLELHEWAIRTNARQFNSNLNAFVDMLMNKHAGLIDEGTAAILWNTFFFCVPVVSLTLASFQRQFAKLGQGSLGWLLLDEAGQATPASACGAIWRSKQCIVLGDTLQIPPVVTIPRGLGKLLQDYYTIKDDCWSPVYSSVQTLADRVTAAGTYVGAAWTGLPLRAHRRCSEPMFSIANVIAYDNQMVRVGADRRMDLPTGESGWIDVQGVTADGHLIREELMVLEEMIGRLGDSLVSEKTFVISPFRSVADICYEEFNVKGRVECGTIHTFQGKEAEVVFLVLGTLPENVRARDWVAGAPNMLNVAVTRAKARLYVIGNRGVWGRHRYFSELVRVLPVKEHFSGRLF
ncbi:MAG TPA: DEAD/DEAH box helicase [Puia sp.]|jgi:hypothetical protein